MSASPLRNRSKGFAKQIVFLCRDIKENHRETVLSNQLLRSGTSIGANLHEAQYAQGIKDFMRRIDKVGIQWKTESNACAAEQQ